MLTKGMFEDRNTQRFGLSSSQFGDDSVVHNGGWYNAQGQKLGWGDLSVTQVERIMRELAPDETFVVLSEGDSYWNFVEKAELDARKNVVAPTEKEPGVDFVAERARYVIKSGSFWYVDDYFEENKDKELVIRGRGGSEVRGHRVARSAAKELIALGAA